LLSKIENENNNKKKTKGRGTKKKLVDCDAKKQFANFHTA
jgi:hypothetical protein